MSSASPDPLVIYITVIWAMSGIDALASTYVYIRLIRNFEYC